MLDHSRFFLKSLTTSEFLCFGPFQKFYILNHCRIFYILDHSQMFTFRTVDKIIFWTMFRFWTNQEFLHSGQFKDFGISDLSRILVFRTNPDKLYSTSLFKAIPVYTSLFQNNQTYSSLFQHIPVYLSLFQPIPVYASLFQPIPSHSSQLKPIPAYSSLFLNIPAYSSPFKIIPG